MASLDIFNNDAFSLTSLTKAINDLPYVPSRIGQLGMFTEEGIDTTSVAIERVGDTLTLVPSAARGSVPAVNKDEKRKMVNINCVHLPKRDRILADEIQSVRAFGTETELETVENKVNKKLARMRRDIDVTIEWQRIGALKGLVLDADGTTVLLDLFSTFGLTKQTHDMKLDVDATKVKLEAVAAKRKIENVLGAKMYTGLRGFCSPSFFDALVGHPAVTKAYDLYLEGQFLREDNRMGFPFAGIFWEEYRGRVSNQDFMADGKAILVPEGVPDMLVTHYAPADYEETVNTIGLPYYAKQEQMPFNKGRLIESQSNPISINTQPDAVIELTI